MKRERLFPKFTEKFNAYEESIINDALYYAVRENLNHKVDDTKTKLMRKALDMMKKHNAKPNPGYMCNRSLDDFFTSCVKRGWEEELENIKWLEVG